MPSDTKMEIERKWLLKRMPHLPLIEQHVVHQAYLYADDNVEIRLVCRFNRDTYHKQCPVVNRRKLTVKLGNGLTRVEAEIKLTEEQFDELQRFVPHPYIVKYFNIFRLPDGSKFECSDVDPGTDSGFAYAEVEFPSEAAAYNFRLPREVLECIDQEVTGDPTYQMKNYWRREKAHEHSVPRGRRAAAVDAAIECGDCLNN